MTPNRRRDRGIAHVWVAMVGIVLVGLMGLATDAGYAYWTGQQLGNAADAAALVGAQHVGVDNVAAYQAAIDTAGANQAAKAPVLLTSNPNNAPGGDVVLGTYDLKAHTFTPTLIRPNAVRVAARRTSTSRGGPAPLFFGAAFGTPTLNIERTAIAIRTNERGAGIVLLNPHAPGALQVQDTAMELTVKVGAIQVNSDSPSAVTSKGGHPTVDAAEIDVVGDVGNKWDMVNFTGQVVKGQAVEDPLASLPAPTWDPLADRRDKNGIGTHLTPGYYKNGISVTGGDITLEPGVYILDGAGLDIGGTASIHGEGVMLYIVNTGRVRVGGNGDIFLSGIDTARFTYAADEAVYNGMTIFQERTNTNDASVGGNGNLNITGTLYFKGAPVATGGTGGTLATQIIADTASISGRGEFRIDYDGRNPVGLPVVYLVE